MNPRATLIKKRREFIAKAQDIIEEATGEGRELTQAELDTVNECHDGIEEATADIAKIEMRAAKSRELVEGITGGSKSNMSFEPPVEAGSEGFKGRNAWAKSVAHNLRNSGSGLGVKALLSGEVATPSAVEVAPLPNAPVRLLDLIPREVLNEHTFSYLRQVLADNKSAVVADNALKPTSVYTFEEVEDKARVVAHLSEPFPIRYATDHASMVQVLDGQMQAGLLETIERLVVSGTGADEEWKGILNTTGVTQVAFANDMVTTLRKARTTLENKGQPITAVAMNPLDIEELDLLREGGTTGGFLLDTDAYERIFGTGVRGVPSLAVPQGKAIAGNWDVTRLMVRENAHTLAATQAGDLFDKNQMKLRTEGRFGFKFTQPGGLAVVDLVAGP